MFNVNGIQVNFYYDDVREWDFPVFDHPVELYKVSRVTHCRLVNDNKDDTHKDFNKTFGEGLAYCSINDNFERAIGRKIALTRALKDAGFDKDTRTAIWKEYLGLVK